MTTTKTLVQSVSITSGVTDIGAAATKALPPGLRHRYYVDVTYTLDNGDDHKGKIAALTKPKLRERIEATETNIRQGILRAEPYDQGYYLVLELSIRR